MKQTASMQPLGTAGAVLLTILLLLGCTWVEIVILGVPGVNRPYTILYLIPVAVGAALLGVRGGILSAAAALCLARLYLFTDNKHGLALVSFPSIAETLEFGALLLGTLAIAFITGRLRSTLGSLNRTNGSLEDANRRLVESEEQRRVFNRDVLLAVTGGKLRLVESGDMPPPALAAQTPLFVQILREPKDASTLRHSLMRVGETTGLNLERIGDLCTATTEAATNAIKHGNGGEATVWSDEEAVTVQIEDHGGGITPAHLARATLEQGFSTRVSLGMGFHLMLQSTDSLALCTDAQGTIIFLQVSKKPRPSVEDAVLARYSALP